LSNDKLELIITPDKSYPYLQVYIPKDRKSIAIENLSATPDAFNNGMGLIIAEPATLYSFTTTYQLLSKQ
jgi:aldose 1-epimerase